MVADLFAIVTALTSGDVALADALLAEIPPDQLPVALRTCIAMLCGAVAGMGHASDATDLEALRAFALTFAEDDDA